MFSVYILKNFKNQIYVGCTHDVGQRVERHDNGDGAEFTKRNKDFKLVYEEKYTTLVEARRREKKENLIKFGKPKIK